MPNLPTYSEHQRKRDLAANELERDFLRILERDELTLIDAMFVAMSLARCVQRLAVRESRA